MASFGRMVWKAVPHTFSELLQSGIACVVAMTIGAARADIATGSGNPAASTFRRSYGPFCHFYHDQWWVAFWSSSLAHTMEQPCRHTYSMAQRTRSGLCSLVVLSSFLKNGSNRKYKQTTAKFKPEKKRALPGKREREKKRMIETEKAQGTSTCLSCTCNGRIGRPLWAAVIQRPIFSKAGLTLTRLLRKSRYNMIQGE